MTATYQLKPYELTDEFLKTLKETFQHREITLTIEAAQDETTYLLQDEKNRQILLNRIASVKAGQVRHTLTLEEAEVMAQ